MATTIERREGARTERGPRLGWTLVIAAIALVAAAASVALVLAQGPATTTGRAGTARERLEAPAVAAPRGAAESTALGPLWCEGELEVVGAVEAGIVPREALDEEPYRTKLLVARGLIPREAAEPCDG